MIYGYLCNPRHTNAVCLSIFICDHDYQNNIHKQTVCHFDNLYDVNLSTSTVHTG